MRGGRWVYPRDFLPSFVTKEKLTHETGSIDLTFQTDKDIRRINIPIIIYVRFHDTKLHIFAYVG